MSKFLSHYRLGYSDVRHKGRVTRVTSVSKDYNDALVDIDKSFSFDVGYIPAGFEHRADLISDLFYDTPANDWLILLVNNIDDPFEGLNVDDRILIPRL